MYAFYGKSLLTLSVLQLNKYYIVLSQNCRENIIHYF